MRIFLRCLAIAASAFAARADALGVSIDGAGEAVLLPYYTVSSGRSSVISVTNHDAEPSAVRVVIAEGRNGRVALSFNVYLDANDAWHGALVHDDAPSPPVAPRLVTNDASCTSTAIPAAGAALRTTAFSGQRDDGWGIDVSRLFEGQVELIELGRLTGSAAALVRAGDCAALRARFESNGAWNVDANADVASPEGRLASWLQIVDVAAGVAFDTPSLVLQSFTAGPRHGLGHTDSQSARIFNPTEKNAQGDFDVLYGLVDGARPADAVSLLLMSVEIEVPYSVEATLDASTQVVVTFPTRPAYLDNLPGGEFAGATRAPFRRLDMLEPDCIAEPDSARSIDRAGHVGALVPLALCKQVNVVEVFGDSAEFNASQGPAFDASAVPAGRLRVDFEATPPHTLTYSAGPLDDNSVSAYGLPVMAFSLLEVRNANAQPGKLASYAMTGVAVRRGESIVDF